MNNVSCTILLVFCFLATQIIGQNKIIYHEKTGVYYLFDDNSFTSGQINVSSPKDTLVEYKTIYPSEYKDFLDRIQDKISEKYRIPKVYISLKTSENFTIDSLRFNSHIDFEKREIRISYYESELKQYDVHSKDIVSLIGTPSNSLFDTVNYEIACFVNASKFSIKFNESSYLKLNEGILRSQIYYIFPFIPAGPLITPLD